MTERKIATALECYVNKDGKWLMLHRHPNKKIMPGVWMAPGGKIERNEGLFECARREIYEETGIKIKNLRIRATGNAYLKDLDSEMFFHFITADWADGELIAETDVGELVWLSSEEIFRLDNLLAELHEVLPFILNENRGIISYKAVYDNGNNMVEFTLEDSS